jgi:hypothetical protein
MSGSGSSYKGTVGSVAVFRDVSSPDATAREKTVRAYREIVSKAAEAVTRGTVTKAAATRDTQDLYDPSLADNTMTEPQPGGSHAYVCLIDHSGSNQYTSRHIRTSSGHLTAIARTLAPNCRIGFRFCSDHCDGDREQQSVNFVQPDEMGDKKLFSSMANIQPASGGDFPESIECWLSDAASIPFGSDLPREKRTLILVTDSWPHGLVPAPDMSMLGYTNDDGCPKQVYWRDAMQRVRQTYGSFVLIGSGEQPRVAKWQLKLFETAPDVLSDEASLNFIDLSTIPNQQHRNAIVGNALLFIIARDGGPQTVEMFLYSLYSKWLTNPIYGEETVSRANQQIRNFGKYLLGIMPQVEIDSMLKRVLVE